MKNPCLEAALGELAKAGIRDVVRSFGGKHQQIRFRTNGSERMYTLPTSPSDFRSKANVRADIRRILKADGMLTPVERKPAAPKPVDRLTILEHRTVAQEQRIAALEQIIERITRAVESPQRQQQH
jgi:hypothetical protein